MTSSKTMTRLPAYLFALVVSAPLLQSCGGGAETIQNPFLGSETAANPGPPAATDDARAFEINVWNNLKSRNRCGQCHGENGQAPTFANAANVNAAYAEAVPLVNLADASSSRLVTKVGSGHNCWETVDSVCADAIENMISNWSGADSGSSSRLIELNAPPIRNPGDSKSFPATADDNGASSFAQTIYPLLRDHCAFCHYEAGDTQQQSPFFANPVDVNAAYAAARSKINIDLPENSRFVQRLLEGHNCWTDCGELDELTGAVSGDAGAMLARIQQFAGAITPTTVAANLITSKALRLVDGVIASGGNRHEANLVALWEFKTGSGTIAFDTSGIEPSVNLRLFNNVSWLGAYGLDFAGGKAQADTQSSRKLNDFIKSSGEYSIEAWVIPANVTQENANIISYDAGSTQKNFALTQTLYNYQHHHRSDLSDSNGEPLLSTEDAGEILQSSLQHVVASYDPINGRKIYINGELIDVADPITSPTSIANWDNSFALVMGQSAANNSTWLGQIRMAAIHNRALTDVQIQQNFDAGVGAKYFLLFSIAEQIGIADSYILFQAAQFDDFSYLFEAPTFINLNPQWSPVNFALRNLRIGINGKEAAAGQAFANLDVTIGPGYSADNGQPLSSLGAVIELEKGQQSDEFFLTFEFLNGVSSPFTDPPGSGPLPPAAPLSHIGEVSDIGVRLFDEINASIAAMTGVAVTNSSIDTLFRRYRQQLPTVANIDAFLSSHQMAIAQLALTSCSERVEIDRALPTGDAGRGLFVDVDFNEPASLAFNSASKRARVTDPVLNAVLLASVGTQPDPARIRELLGASTRPTLTTSLGAYTYDSLITQMLSNPNATDNSERTAQIAKAVCAAAVGSAAMLIQ